MIDLFPIPLLNQKIEVDCKALASDILQLRRKKDGKPHMDYTSFFEQRNDKMDGVKWDDLRKEIVSASNALSKTVNLDCVINEDNVEAWWNVYEGQHHCWHAHGRALWSGTFYVQMNDDMQPIRFKSPIQGLIGSWADPAFRKTRWAQERSFTPEPGSLLIWPSWLEHTVPEQFNDVSTEPRITISFNIGYKR